MGMSLSYEKQLEYYGQEDHVNLSQNASKIGNAGFNLSSEIKEFSSIKKNGFN